MTLPSTTVKVQYAGDGSTAAFTVTFTFWDADDFQVVHTNSAGTETTWTRGSQYTVSGGSGATGTVTVITSPTDYTPATGETLTFTSALSKVQATDLVAGGAFPTADVETQLDKIVRMLQEDSEALGRALKFAVSSAFTGVAMPDLEAGKVLTVNGAGTALTWGTPTDGSALTLPLTVANGGTGAATLAAARTALGIEGMATFNVKEATYGAAGDGVADDTAEIQAAMDAAVAAGGGVIYFPAGTYIISAPLRHKSNTPIGFLGEGDHLSILQSSGNFNAILQLEGRAYGTAALTGDALDSVTVTWGGYYTSTPTVTIGGDGSGATATVDGLDASGRITGVTVSAGGAGYTTVTASFSSPAAANRSTYFEAYNMEFNTTGDVTKCVQADIDAWKYDFTNCRFVGDGAVSLVLAGGTTSRWESCEWTTGNASTVAFDIIAGAINSHFARLRIGGSGRGLKIRNITGVSTDRPQGLTFTQMQCFCTGNWNLYAQESLHVHFIGCNFTAATVDQILADTGPEHYYFTGCIIGGNTGVDAVDLAKTVELHWAFVNCDIYNAARGIVVRADSTAGNQLDTLLVSGCCFQNITTASLDLDSVLNAVICDNTDRGTPTSGSWITRSNGASAAAYTFTSNRWHTAAPATFDTGATYNFSNNTGHAKAIGYYESAETALNNDAQITFAHGLGLVPKRVEVVLRANTATAQGWADNEESTFPLHWHGAAIDDGVDVTWDATNVYITQGAAIQLLDHTSFNDETITQTEYDWVVRAWA